jgi:hypothetical protein
MARKLRTQLWRNLTPDALGNALRLLGVPADHAAEYMDDPNAIPNKIRAALEAHCTLRANGWTDATEWCLCYQKDNSLGYLLLSAADWENDEFNLATVYVAQMDEEGNELEVLHNGTPLETALANLPA